MQENMIEGTGVRFELAGGVGRIVLDRPDAANVIDLPTARAFGAAVAAAERSDVRVVLLTGAGKRFCAGGDARSFLAADDPATYVHELATTLESHLRRPSELPKPVVAGVHGAVAGAGLAFVLNSDVVVAGSATKFLLAYTGIGLSPDCGVSYLLPRAVGRQRALELALTGRVLTADEARSWGLVTEVADDTRVLERATEIARVLVNGPAVALGETKRLIRSSSEVSREQSARDEAATIARLVTTDDATRLVRQLVGR